MGAEIGKNVRIYPSAVITFPWLLELGENCVIGWRVRIYNLGKISIGSNTVISQYSHICGGNHDFRNPGFKLLRQGIRIGNGVWVASDAFIGPGVTIGDYAVIAARAVVVRNVHYGEIVGGNPARKIGIR